MYTAVDREENSMLNPSEFRSKPFSSTKTDTSKDLVWDSVPLFVMLCSIRICLSHFYPSWSVLSVKNEGVVSMSLKSNFYWVAVLHKLFVDFISMMSADIRRHNIFIAKSFPKHQKITDFFQVGWVAFYLCFYCETPMLRL